MRRYLLAVAATILSILGMLGCAQPLNGDFYPPPEVAYLPFIESAEVPAQVTENTPFDMKVNVSCALKPEALNGIARTNSGSFGYDQKGFRLEYFPSDDPVKRLVMRLWIVEPLSTGDPVTDFTVTISSLKAGEYVIALESAPSQQQGGMSHLFSIASTYHYRPLGVELMGLTPGAVFQEFPITVVPAED